MVTDGLTAFVYKNERKSEVQHPNLVVDIIFETDTEFVFMQDYWVNL
jgi:hypothetical protein